MGIKEEMVSEVSRYILEAQDSVKKLEVDYLTNKVLRAQELILETLSRSAPVICCGNGGSFADASHFCGELVNQFMYSHPAFPFLTLGSNNTVLTAWSNDHSYETSFLREFEAFASPHSTLCIFTTSGTSPNILKVLNAAEELGVSVIGFTSKRGEEALASRCDVLFVAPTSSTSHAQEIHIIVYHALALAIEKGYRKNG